MIHSLNEGDRALYDKKQEGQPRTDDDNKAGTPDIVRSIIGHC